MLNLLEKDFHLKREGPFFLLLLIFFQILDKVLEGEELLTCNNT